MSWFHGFRCNAGPKATISGGIGGMKVEHNAVKNEPTPALEQFCKDLDIKPKSKDK